MYVTRPLSGYKNSPCSLSLPAPEGPNSGILVIQDEEPEPEAYCCFKFSEDLALRELPVPQNRIIIIRYVSGSELDDNPTATFDYVYLIPVLDQPLSSGRYYAIQAKGKHSGKAHTSSADEDMGTCCLGKYVRDAKPRPLDPTDKYQQFEIRSCGPQGFHGVSMVSDIFPPQFLRTPGWQIYTETPKYLALEDAPGLDAALRAQLPEFTFPAFFESSVSMVVGKWYCPFMFIKEGKLRDQVRRSMYYKMTLEQRWEQIYGCENAIGGTNSVTLDAVVQREVVMVGGAGAENDGRSGEDGVIWFRSSDNIKEVIAVGLHSAIIERMKWEQERFGWVEGDGREVRVKKVEEFEGVGGWRRYNCYVLVERFVLKRMDGSLVMTYDFKHTHQMKSKWE